MIALSFFSGAMGLDLGLEKAGISVRAVCEFDQSCRETIAKNRPGLPILGDVWDVTPEQIRKHAGISPTDEIDLIVGGPPCQAFSTAGLRKGFGDRRGSALIRYIELVEQLRPRYMVLENVRGLLSATVNEGDLTEGEELYKPGGALLMVVNRLKAAGYGVSFNLYNSANFGTPQVRERLVMICHRGGEELPYLEPTHSDDPKFGLPKWNTFKDAVAGLNDNEHHSLEFPEKRLKYYRMLNPGENWKSLPIEIQKEAMGRSFYSGGGKTGFLRRLAWDKPAPTLVTHPAMPATDLAHPVENRPLSIEEYKRVQQFPDDWFLCGTLLEQYKQVGNAVPIGLGEAIGKLILKHANGELITTVHNFQFSRYKDTDHVTWLSKHAKM